MLGLDPGQLLATFGYGAVAFLIFIEDFGVPSPGETVLIAAAAASSQGDLNIVLVGIVAFCAAVLGDNVGYALGRYGGRRLILRLGKRIRVRSHHLVTEGRLDHAQSFFETYGSWIIVVARFVEGLRQLNGIIAGSLHYTWARFLGLNALGAAIWVGFWTTVSYFAGDWVAQIHGSSRWFLIGGGILLVAGAAWILYLWKGRSRGSQEQSGATREDGS